MMNFEIPETIKVDILYCQKTLGEYVKYYQMWINDLQNIKKDNRTKRVSSLFEREINHIGREQKIINDRLRLELDAYIIEMEKHEIIIDRITANTYIGLQLIEYFNKNYPTDVYPINTKLRTPAEEFYGKHLNLLGEVRQMNEYARITGLKLNSKKSPDKIEESTSLISMPNKYITNNNNNNNNNNIFNNPQSTSNHPMVKQISLLKPKSKCISLLSKKSSTSSPSSATTISSSALFCTPILTSSPTIHGCGGAGGVGDGDGDGDTLSNLNNNTYFHNNEILSYEPSSSSSPYLLEPSSSSSSSPYLLEPSSSLSSPSLTQTIALPTDPVALLSTLVLPSSTSVTILPPRAEITTANINNSRMNLLQALKKAKIQVNQSNLKANTTSISTTSSSKATIATTTTSSSSSSSSSSSNTAHAASNTKTSLPKKSSKKSTHTAKAPHKKSAKLKKQKRKKAAPPPNTLQTVSSSSSSSISPSSSSSSIINDAAVASTAVSNSTTSIVKTKKTDRESVDSQSSVLSSSSLSHDSLLDDEHVEPEQLDKEQFLRIFELYTPSFMVYLKTRRSKRRRRQVISTARGDFHYGNFDLQEKRRNKRSILYSPPATRAFKRRKRLEEIEKLEDINKECNVMSSITPLPLSSSSAISAAPPSSSSSTVSPSPTESQLKETNENDNMCIICLKNDTDNKLNECKLCQGFYHIICHSNSLMPELLQHHENICPKCLTKPMVDLS